MTQSITGRFLGGAVRLADLLHLRWAITGLVHRLPPSTRLWLGKLQVRTGYMHGLTLVPEQELQRSFEAALRLMGAAVGGAGATYLEFGVFVGRRVLVFAHDVGTSWDAGARATSLPLVGQSL